MKAAVFQAVGAPLAVQEVKLPTPTRSQVLARIDRCGICGSDIHMTELHGFLRPAAILGHEIAATVVDVGSSVSHIKKGDRIAILPIRSCGRCASCIEGQPAWCRTQELCGGGYAEFITAEEIQCVKLPDSLSAEDGALVEPLAVGLHGLRISGMEPGARVLVLGSGPIGLAATFWARQMGAGHIGITARTSNLAYLAEPLGADTFLDARIAGDRDEVSLALGGEPDLVIDAVGAPGLIDRAIGLVRPRGTVLVLGLCTSPDSFQPLAMVTKEVRIQGAAFYSVGDFEEAADALHAGHVEPRLMITDRIALPELPTAFEALRKRTSQCKVMVAPGGST